MGAALDPLLHWSGREDLNRAWLRQSPVSLRGDIKSPLHDPTRRFESSRRASFWTPTHQGSRFEPRLAAPIAGLRRRGI